MIVDRLGTSRVRRARHLLWGLLGSLWLLTWGMPPIALAQDVDGDLPPTPSLATPGVEAGNHVEDWAPTLREWGQRPARSQLDLRHAELALASGNKAVALAALERSIQSDPRNSRAWFLQGRIHLLSANPLFLSDLLGGSEAALSSYMDQSRWASRFLLQLDLILGLTLVWLILVLLLRYLPFLHHQIRSVTQADTHTEGKGLLLWIPALAPLALGLGIIPSLCVAFLIVWLFTGRRERVILSLLVLLFAAQGPWSARLGTPLTGVASDSTPSLVQRAARETPGYALQTDLDAAVTANPDSAPLEFARGLVSAREGRFEQSARRFQEVLRLTPDDAKATNNLANNHYYRGDYDRAVAGYQRSASLDPLEGSTHYNLAQAYIKKLFFKEGGEHMQLASRAGFALGNPEHRLPTGAVYYQAPGAASAWKTAWDQEAPVLLPFDLLTKESRWLGVPGDHISIWLLSTLVLALISIKLVPREKLVFECANCGVLSCPRCSGEHDGNILCLGCHNTTRRARSEVVLTTLLRNRRRATEFSFHTKVRRLNSWLFGAGDVYNGLQKHGVVMSFLVAWCASELLIPGTLLPSPWSATQNYDWLSTARIIPLAGLMLVFLISRFGRSTWRSRSFHLHPASMVRLSDLMDGRNEKRLKA